MLHAIKRLPPQPRRSRRPKGWTHERRAHQAIIIHNWKPWRHATGPKTARGKTASSMNALVHGARSRSGQEEARRVRLALRGARHFNALVRGLCTALRRNERACAQSWREQSGRGRDKFVAFAAAPMPHRRA